ncbi:Peptide hydrolase [Mycena sanguinolenta]|uniref:Peptide hydrolase n=1 Tax=Mycena sanguinolenta TaxID=230812 RepID=A0A8H6YHI9_9AGAR|nr:Peptide hydrolase [Mycena sanguinolenta]
MLLSILAASLFCALELVSSQFNVKRPFQMNPPNQFDNQFDEPGFDLDLDDLRLVQFSLEEEPVWITERDKLMTKTMGKGYLDITATQSLGKLFTKRRFAYPNPNSTIVSGIIGNLTTAEPRKNLDIFSSFRTRYCHSDSGRASSEWLLHRIRNYTTELASEKQKPLISVELFEHTWKQPSVIIRMASKDSQDSDPITVIGAHSDSVNIINPYLPAPGADDDGSGTVTILEAYRVLLLAGYIPTSPLEFHFYAAEECGLLGSQAIVAAYEAAAKEIKGMIQFDMTAWVKAGSREEMAVITSSSDVELTKFEIKLIERYVDIPWVWAKYPGKIGPTDHLSWTRAGYQSCHVLESTLPNANARNIHTTNDTIDISHEFSFDHMLQYSKLAVAPFPKPCRCCRGRRRVPLLRRLLHQSHARRAITHLEMPAMSPTMTEGGIAAWKKKNGESFTAGDVLLEIETDKATIDVEAQDDGVMGMIVVPEGSKNIVVGKVIALLAEEGDDISNLQPPQEDASPRRKQQAEAAAESPAPSPPAQEFKPSPPPPAHSSTPPTHSRPLFPSVHRLLLEHDISTPSQIKGTGVRGMLTKGDVLAFLGKASGPMGTYKETPPPMAQAQAQPKKEEYKPLDGPSLRQLIVSTMLQNSIKARNPPSNSLAQASFDSILADYLPSTPTAPTPPKSSSTPPPPKTTNWLDGLI